MSNVKKAGIVAITFLSSVLAGFSLLGCGGSTGGSSSGGGGNTNPTITLVTVSALPSAVTVGQTVTCTANVQGTGAFSTGVTWTATNATITPAGVLTPSSAGTATCIATSTQDPTKSGTANITISPVPSMITSVTVSPSVTSILTNQTTTFLATVIGTGAFSSGVTWTATNGSITAAGVFTPPTTAGTALITATSTQDPTKSGTATVTITVPVPTINSVSVTCNPSSISTADTTTCTTVVNGTGNFDPRVTWTATNGTMRVLTNSTAELTPSAAGTAIITATSTQDPTKSGTTNVMVTTAVPLITGTNISYIYADAEPGFIGGIQLNGSGFALGDTVSVDSSVVGLGSVQRVNSGQIAVLLAFDTRHTSPGWVTLTVASPDGTKSTSYSIPFIGNQNMLAVSPSGELNFLERSTGVIWQYKGDGTPDGSITASRGNGITVDDKTDHIFWDQSVNTVGLATVAVVGGGAGGIGDVGDSGMGISAKNGNGCVAEPIVNYFSCFSIPQIITSFPPFNSVTLGNQPFSVAMGLFGTETDAFVFSRDGTPTLWKVNVSGGMIISASQPIPGVTSWTTLQTNSFAGGGWQVAVFDKGPASGTVAVLSTADNLLTFFDASSMRITNQVTLTGLPFRIAADMTNGNLIVAYADQAKVLTTFMKVNPLTGVATSLMSTTPLLAVGFQISFDGKNIYACQRAQCAVLANQ